MPSSDLLALSLPPSNQRLALKPGNNVGFVATQPQPPKSMPPSAILDPSPTTSQIASTIPPYAYGFQSLTNHPDVANSMIRHNPGIPKPLNISFGNAGGCIERQNMSNGKTTRYVQPPYLSSADPTAHAFPNFHPMMDTSLLRFQLFQQRAEMALLARNTHSPWRNEVLTILRRENHLSSISKLAASFPNYQSMLPPMKTSKDDPEGIKESAGTIHKSLLKKSELSHPQTMRMYFRPKTLYMPGDRENVNAVHRFVRSELLELFQPSPPTESNPHSRSRVGLRCVYCAQAKNRKTQKVPATYSFYPKSLEDIYFGVCTWQRLHFVHCKNVPKTKTQKYLRLKEDKRRGKKAYWAHSAYELGLRNVSHRREGIVWCQETRI